MNRADFLKRLGLGVVAIPLVPKLIGALPAAEEVVKPKIKTTWVEGADHVYDYTMKPEIHDEMLDKYGHYEQPWIHDSNPWPLQQWDLILTPNEKTYVVTEVRYGSAVLTPHVAGEEVIIAHKGDEMIRIPNCITYK